MKKIILFISLALSINIANSQSFTTDNITYFPTSDSTADVVYYENLSGNVVINSTISNNGVTYKVKSIGENAFNDCTGLTSIVIPNTVTSIGSKAFFNCIALSSITIPNSVKTIGESTFYGCNNLTTITLPSSLTEISDGLFSACSKLELVTIPSSVTIINNLAFSDCSSLTSITIPNSVTSIGSHCFVNCTALSNVTISNAATIIKQYAFSHCDMLTSIVIPNSVTILEQNVFYECKNLKSVTLSNKITELGIELFFNCTNLESISIPNSVTSIGDAVFANCSKLSSITIPNSVTSIGSGVFSDCISLKSIVFPNSIINFGSGNLLNCNALTTAVLPNTLTTIPAYTFSDCSSLLTVAIPNTVSSIENEAFKYCTSLQSISLPEGLTKISLNSFINCNKLTSINIPKNVTILENYAFAFCTGLTEVTVNWFSPLELNETVFYDLNLANVTLFIPKGSKDNYKYNTIQWRKFKLGGTTFVFNGLTYEFTSDSTTEVGIQATTYSGAANIPSVAVFEGKNYKVNGIGFNAFAGCNLLTSVAIPNSVKYIGIGAFSNCIGLNSVVIPNSVTIIDNNAFSDCSNLTSISIPSSVTTIGSYAFYYCSGLTTMNVAWKTPLSVSNDNFGGVDYSNITLNVPFGKKAVYDTTTFWKEFNIIALNTIKINNLVFNFTSDSTVSIGANPLATGVLTIPAKIIVNGTEYKVTGIEPKAFAGSKITSIKYTNTTLNSARLATTVASYIETIGEKAFENCTDLTSIDIPNSVKSIGDSAFANCTNLNNVNVNWTTPLLINANVFRGVTTSMVTLNVPLSTEIEYSNTAVWKEFNLISNVNDMDYNNDVTIYPNPTSTFAKIDIKNKNATTLEIIDSKGILIQSLNIVGLNQYTIDNLGSGLYIIKIKTNNNTITEKLLIQ